MMMGLTGTVVGASAVGVAGALRLLIETWFPGMAPKNDHQHHMQLNLQSQRHQAIQHWRAGLARARDNHRRWSAQPGDSAPPNIVGDEWFEGLRPHLPVRGEAAQWRTAVEVVCDYPTVVALSLEIGRVEDMWMNESHKRRRRSRGKNT